MSDSFVKYFQERFKIEAKKTNMPGPVVTISREFGCDAKTLAALLASKLNELYLPIGAIQTWAVVGKDILLETARQLQTDSKKIEYVFSFEQRNLVDDFLLSLSSKNHLSDWFVKEAIKKVIREFAETGYSIIIGRAGAQIARDIDKSLHIRLIAPFEHRKQLVMKKYDLLEKDAEKKTKEMDHNREKLISMFVKETNCHDCYDVYYNIRFLSQEQICNSIISLMQLKKLI
jgi:cytidylate kinase